MNAAFTFTEFEIELKHTEIWKLKLDCGDSMVNDVLIFIYINININISNSRHFFRIRVICCLFCFCEANDQITKSQSEQI